MNDARIQIYPARPAANTQFLAALQAAARTERPNLTYRDTFFRVTYELNGRVEKVYAQLTSLTEPLPKCFTDGELDVQGVLVESLAPHAVTAPVGWYIGDNFGFPGVRCCIDPQGAMHTCVSTAYAVGADFASTVEFYQAVIAGDLKPGDESGPWSRAIRAAG